MDVMTAYVQGLADVDLLAMTRRNLVTAQMRVVRTEARNRGLHGFAHAEESRPEACLCGAMFVEGFHLDVVKRAHLAAEATA